MKRLKFKAQNKHWKILIAQHKKHEFPFSKKIKQLKGWKVIKEKLKDPKYRKKLGLKFEAS